MPVFSQLLLVIETHGAMFSLLTAMGSGKSHLSDATLAFLATQQQSEEHLAEDSSCIRHRPKHKHFQTLSP